MLITPRPGVDRRNLHEVLSSVHNAVSNLRSRGSDGAYRWLLAYLDWTNDAVRMLSSQISSADLDRLVLTKGYERLLSGVGTMTGSQMEVQRAVNGLVSRELEQRIAAFEEAMAALDEQISSWATLGEFVVPDTSFFIEHPDKLEVVDFASLIGSAGTPVHILVPIVVVDELDGLKQSKQRQARWRARYTLAVLDRVFARATGPARLHEQDATESADWENPRDTATIELLFDPPGHVRLPINDDEIIDRALAAQPLAARRVTLLTYDTGQAMRARAAGLQVQKFRMPQEDEPASETSV